MRRRDFITGIAGSAAAWPLAAQAQQPERVRRVGVLEGQADDPEIKAQPRYSGKRSNGSDGRRLAMFALTIALRMAAQNRRKCLQKSWLPCNPM